MKRVLVFSLILLSQGAINKVKSQKTVSVEPVILNQSQKVDVTIKRDPWENLAENLRIAQEQKREVSERNRKWALMRDPIISTARVHYKNNNFDSVLVVLAPHEYLRPSDLEFYTLLGKSYYYSAMYSAAKVCLQTALEIGKESSLYLLLGNSYEYLGDHKEAQKTYKKGSKAGDNDCKLRLER
jgi:tetratricopeptide (TPR) repeat protein